MDDLGRRGETAAVRALRRAGYRIVARNWRCAAGEVDVVALDGETVVLVEVKATRAAGPSPAHRVDHAKRERLRGAWRVLSAHRRFARRPHRFDVVAVRAEGGALACAILRGAFSGPT
jgi:putative endonuclease